MRRSATAFVLVFALTIMIGATASASGKGPGRPFPGATAGRGVASGTVTQFTPHGISFDGAGITTHLGRTTVHMSGCWPCDGPLSYAGTGQLTAANGDSLSATVDWGFDGTLAMTVTGGTGRFHGATGSATGTIVIEPGTVCCTRNATMTFSGTISTGV